MELVGKLVVRFLRGDPDVVAGVGIAEGYFSDPTYVVKDGENKTAWVESLTREATLEEQVSYWRGRATKAEDNGL